MKLSISRDELSAAIAAPCKIAAKASVDYLSCILITAGDAVSFEATDQVESVRVAASALVESPGRVLVSGRSLQAIVKTLPDEAVWLETEDGGLVLTCGKSRFALRTLDADLLPAFPKVEATQQITVPCDMFDALVKVGAAFAATGNEAREIYHAALIEAADGRLRIVSTDGYRLVESAWFSDSLPEFRECIDARQLMGFATDGASDVTISASDNQVRLECGPVAFITRTISGRYPNVDMMFDYGETTRAEIGRAAVVGAAKRAMAISAKAPMKLAIDGCLNISLDGGDNGSMGEALDCKADGKCCMHVNAAYFRDGVGAMASDTVLLSMENPMKPLHIIGDDTHAVIMPIHVKD